MPSRREAHREVSQRKADSAACRTFDVRLDGAPSGRAESLRHAEGSAVPPGLDETSEHASASEGRTRSWTAA